MEFFNKVDQDLYNYFNFCICQDIRTLQPLSSASVGTKVIKVAWFVLRVKNLHSESTSDLQGPLGKAKLSYVHCIFRQGEAELCTSKLTLMFHCIPGVSPKQLRA